METLSIGQVAKQTGVSVETIRFYEHKGLIEEPRRKESGYRQYMEDDLKKFIFIQQAKTLGFSLNEIKELLSLRSDPKTTSREIKRIAELKLENIEEKLKMLRKMKRTLESLIEQCPGKGPLNDCPILEALDSVKNN
ncbi:MAG: MerR family transcriptional regulator [Gammaproteobacteria bacterium]